MIESHEKRACEVAAKLEELARKIRHGSFTGGWGHFNEWHVWEEIDKLKAPGRNLSHATTKSA